MTEAVQATVVPLTSESVLPTDATLRVAIERIAAHPQQIFFLTKGAMRRGVLANDLRSAWHDHVPAETPVWDLARAQLVTSSVGVARGLLAERPELEVAVALGDAGTPSLVKRVVEPLRAAILMAGGFGTRLKPLTDRVPKPLLEVGGRPLLDWTIRHLHAHGIRKLFLSVHYLAEKIREFVGDGARHGMEVAFLEEREPLGTGAGLALMPRLAEPFLVVNGDVLTNADLGALGRFHVQRGNLVTVATCLLPTQLKYGVVHSDGDRLVGIEEKPTLRHAMNAGIYAFAPGIADFVKPGAVLPMVPLLNELVEKGERVGRFPLVEYWNDIGAHADYERAQGDVAGLFPRAP